MSHTSHGLKQSQQAPRSSNLLQLFVFPCFADSPLLSLFLRSPIHVHPSPEGFSVARVSVVYTGDAAALWRGRSRLRTRFEVPLWTLRHEHESGSDRPSCQITRQLIFLQRRSEKGGMGWCFCGEENKTQRKTHKRGLSVFDQSALLEGNTYLERTERLSYIDKWWMDIVVFSAGVADGHHLYFNTKSIVFSL